MHRHLERCLACDCKTITRRVLWHAGLKSRQQYANSPLQLRKGIKRVIFGLRLTDRGTVL
jgi:hypothetical protein